jgi:hypothetical protein
MKLVGHSTRCSIFDRYAIVTEADLSEAGAKLSALHRAQQPHRPAVSMLLKAKRRLGRVLVS